MELIDKNDLIKRMSIGAPMNWTDTDFELGEESQYKSDREVVESCAEIKVIPIPPRATNGDMIKAIFPNANYNEEWKATAHFYIDDNNGHTEISGASSRDWWNAPYRKE